MREPSNTWHKNGLQCTRSRLKAPSSTATNTCTMKRSRKSRILLLVTSLGATTAPSVAELIRSLHPGPCAHGCSGLGLCDPASGACSCFQGFSGPTCEIGACPNSCSGHGRCVAPSIPVQGLAPSGSIMHQSAGADDAVGRLSVTPSAGGCECFEGHTGHDCSLLRCPGDCFGHGVCVNGTCVCEASYTGAACSIVQCSSPCRNGGVCAVGGCLCRAGFGGNDCGIANFTATIAATADIAAAHIAAAATAPTTAAAAAPRTAVASFASTSVACAGGCSGRGLCASSGTCECQPPWQPPSCAFAACPRGCSGHGYCNASSGSCTCKAGFQGADCATSHCPMSCHHRGTCGTNGACVCDVPFVGTACELTVAARAVAGVEAQDDAIPPEMLVRDGQGGAAPLLWQRRIKRRRDSKPTTTPPTTTTPTPTPAQQPPPPSQPQATLLASPPPPLAAAASTPPAAPPASPPAEAHSPPPPAEVELADEEHLADPSSCPYGCGRSLNRGFCEAGVCYCKLGWTGAACQMPLSAVAVGRQSSRE